MRERSSVTAHTPSRCRPLKPRCEQCHHWRRPTPASPGRSIMKWEIQLTPVYNAWMCVRACVHVCVTDLVVKLQGEDAGLASSELHSLCVVTDHFAWRHVCDARGECVVCMWCVYMWCDRVGCIHCNSQPVHSLQAPPNPHHQLLC